MNAGTSVSIGEYTFIIPHITGVKLDKEEPANGIRHSVRKLTVFLTSGNYISVPFNRREEVSPEQVRDTLLTAIHAYYTAQLEGKHATNNIVQGVRPHAGMEGEAG